MADKKYLITAALPYANGSLHIGHLAGVYLPADIYARYLRMKGKGVLFVSGSDEGGVAITLRARKEKRPPKAIIDHYHKENKYVFKKLGIAFDIYDRTSSKAHFARAQAFFNDLQGRGILLKKESQEYYDQSAQEFLADRYLVGTCPRCGHSEAYGDQCEACGSDLSPQELIMPRSRLSGAPLVKKKTTHWYLPLDAYQEWLTEWIKKKEGLWRPNVFSQCMGWLNQGLRPRAITRDLSWGIPLPLDEEGKGKVLYVWFEAPIGYISATAAWAEAKKEAWEKWWIKKEEAGSESQSVELVHFIGKDNIVFHALIFPMMLHAHSKNYHLPSDVVGNEFMNLAGEKISTSRNHAIWLIDYLKKYPGKADILRYVLCANAPERKDSNFTWDDFKKRNNGELVGILGNLIHRVFHLIHKYHGGVIPEMEAPPTGKDEAFWEEARHLSKEISDELEQKNFRKALSAFINIARLGNRYLAETTPWKEKNSKKRGQILYHSIQLVGYMAHWGHPFMPFAMEKLAGMLHLKIDHWPVIEKNPTIIAKGHTIEAPTPLFEKIDTISL